MAQVSEGEVVVARLAQADGGAKLRPIILLRKLPGMGDFLVCGVSSQTQRAVEGFDVVVESGSKGFAQMGLKVNSVIRLNFLATVPIDRMERRLGSLPDDMLGLLRTKLAEYIVGSKQR
jgi:mRNA interferase MazF